METFKTWLEDLHASPDYADIERQLALMSIRPFDIFSCRDDIDISVKGFFSRLQAIIEFIIAKQTSDTILFCEQLLENWNNRATKCRFCPSRKCSMFIRGNCGIRVPKEIFSRVEDEFDTVIDDVRGSFKCSCRGGVGKRDCGYNCVINAISTYHDTWLRPYVPEMDPYFDKRCTDAYAVKPYIEVVKPTARDVIFKLHVYTKHQATSMHHRIQDLLAELEWPHRHWKIVSTPREGDCRQHFNHIFTRTGEVSKYAGAIPDGAITLSPKMVAQVGPRLRELRTLWRLPSLNIRPIPCNVHRICCLTCGDHVSPKVSRDILRELSTMSSNKA